MNFRKLSRNILMSTLPATAIVAPLASVISCSTSVSAVKQFKILPTYTGQADQLIALGIKPDYYPLQLDASQPFDYLLNASRYMSQQSDVFKTAFESKVRSLIPQTKGVSWWNQQALSAGEKGSDPSYWQHMGGTLVLYEHYLLDDSAKVVDYSTAPQHIDSPETFIQTNFRASRDPYTRLPKVVIDATMHDGDYDKLKQNTTQDAQDALKFVDLLLETARKVEGTTSAEMAADGKPAPTGIPKMNESEIENEGLSWLYNNYFFAKQWHTNFDDNAQFQATSFKDWLLTQRSNSDHTDNWVFDKDKAKDDAIANLFFDATYTAEEDLLKTFAKKQYEGTAALTLHHPIYEQQEEIGGAPMFEGAMRDNALYLYDLASKVDNAFTKDLNSEGTKYLLKEFANDSRLNNLKNALENADKINIELRQRMAKIKAIVDALNNPTFGLVTIAPGGGESTVQTSSKYSFLYRELGFTQPTPDLTQKLDTPGDGGANGAFFNMDDNGWWWNISSTTQGSIDASRTQSFNKFDLGFITANSAQYDGVLKDADRESIAQMFGEHKETLVNRKVDYNMWNEGLKTPFVIHMMLDQIMEQMHQKYSAQISQHQTEWDAAKDWGSYFSQDYIK